MLIDTVNHELTIRLATPTCYATHRGISEQLGKISLSPCDIQDLLEMGRWHGSLTAAVLADIETSQSND